MSSQRIEPIPGYAPAIGRLVCMLTYTREGLVSAVSGLDQQGLDHLHDAESNAIGALLAHANAVEWYYQVVTFEERTPGPDDEAPRAPALDLGEAGRRLLRGRSLDSYLQELAETRRTTLQALACRDDAWLERPLPHAPDTNPHWAWFHVAEDEISHRGQIRWLRSRLPGSARTSTSTPA
ncbi:MAG: DUF664 domain-containing protein [Vicinamibacteria bacterium]